MRTGCYLNGHRESALLVKITPTTVAYISTKSGKIDLHVDSVHEFRREFTVFLPDYPIRKAALGHWRSNIDITPNARKVIELLVKEQVAEHAEEQPTHRPDKRK